MLVVVEDRNITFFLEFLFNFKAARRRDVFKVHTAEAAGNQIDGIDNLIDILALDAERECIDIAKCFKEDAFAFHNRHPGFRSDIAESQDSGAICYDEAHIMSAGHVLLDFKARLCDARRISQREVFLGRNRNGCNHFDLTLPFCVFFQAFLCVVHVVSPFSKKFSLQSTQSTRPISLQA